MLLTIYMKWILVLIYFPKIIEHKNALIEAGNHVNQFVPKAFEISTKRLQEHDKSKFDLEELLPYAKKFVKSNLEFFEEKFMIGRMPDTDRILEEIEKCEYEGIGKLGDILADFERILFERSLGRDERSEALLFMNSEREKLLSIEATSEEWEKALNHHYDHNDHHIEFWNRKGRNFMDDVAVVEMVADHIAANIVYSKEIPDPRKGWFYLEKIFLPNNKTKWPSKRSEMLYCALQWKMGFTKIIEDYLGEEFKCTEFEQALNDLNEAERRSDDSRSQDRRDMIRYAANECSTEFEQALDDRNEAERRSDDSRSQDRRV